MLSFQRSGYRSRSLASDVLLGIFDGLDNALWCYGFATILFAGALSAWLPLGITILLVGWALLGLWVVATSRVPTHLTNMDEQGVVILASLGVTLTAYLGGDAEGPRGIATLLGLIVVTSLAVAISFLAVGYYRLTRLLELLPYPVICGFMAGIGWLLLEAAVYMLVEVSISGQLLEQLARDHHALILAVTIACGAGLIIFTQLVNRAWALPLASLIIFAGFYAVAGMLGLSREELVASGWLFEVSASSGGALTYLTGFGFADVDFYFIASVIPEILTIVFLALLNMSMSLTAMVTAGHNEVSTSEEFRNQGLGNFLCAAVSSPPGYTDVASSILYEEFGASSRWMPLISHLVLLLVAVVGTWFIGWMPKVLVGATILLFAFQLIYKWMVHNVRGFQPIDFAIVCIILGMVIFIGFMVGIVTGIILTLLLFVLRYSMISAIQGRYSLGDYRSSVERPSGVNQVLDEHGSGALIYTLRGFLFFGTANAILDRIKQDLSSEDVTYTTVLLDFKRVTGIDISALNTFVQVQNKCTAANVQLLYSGVAGDIERQIIELEAVTRVDGSPMFFPELDFAVEYMEELVLRTFSPDLVDRSIRRQLTDILDDDDKAGLLLEAMTRRECPAGETLFSQGDVNTGFFILESGSLSAFISTRDAALHRVKKFGAGSLIGEMSAYTADHRRTATVVADTDSVLYHMPAEKLDQPDMEDSRLAAVVHELIARTLGARMSYMNRRLLLEME